MRLFSLLVILVGALSGAAYLLGDGDGVARHGLSPADTTADAEAAHTPQAATDTVIAVSASNDELAPALERLARKPLAKSLPVIAPMPAVATPVAESNPLVQAVMPVDAGADIVDIRRVTAGSVNVREGPSTSFSVLGRVTLGELVSVVEIAENGWAHIRLEGDGFEGWMSARFLSK